MKKFLFTLLFSSFCLNAEIQTLSNVKITEVAAYDDFQGGIVRIALSQNASACSAGVYLNRNATGFGELYSLTLVAATTGREIKIQLYDDRITAGLCEVDGIRLFF